MPVVFVMLDGNGFDFCDDDTYCIISYYGQDMSRFLTGFWLTVVPSVLNVMKVFVHDS